MVNSAKKISIEKEYPLPRELVWKLLSDTDRLNRFIGLFPVQFSPAKKIMGDVFYREALAKVAGIIPLSWKEYPFQWTEFKYYSVERKYQGGPLKHFKGGIELLDSESNGTNVRLFGEFTPRNVWGLAAIPLTGVKSMHNTMKYIDDCLKKINDGFEAYLPQKATKNKINLNELRGLEKRLAKMPVESSYINLLHQHLTEKSDHEVIQMKTISIAKQWKMEPDQVLRLFLYATKAGILNLSWNLICPNCRVSKADYSSLSQLKGQFHCDFCGINYDANFENYVELNFSVHPSIRRASANSYCVGGPMITPHVKMQKVIEQSKTVEITIPHTTESMRLRVLQVNHTVKLKKGSIQTTKESIHYSDNGWSSPVMQMASESGPLNILNSSSNDIVLVLEQDEWINNATTAAKVTAMQEFRDLFSSEVLAPGQQVGIENVTILFSDLKGSTSLYESMGDANAYGQVRRHFDYLTQWISKNSGSVVKTIGDAVMAVFHLPDDGLKAALKIQKHVSEFNENRTDEIVLKIGLYTGPAIAVNSNDQLDYFGRTVNIAARIQGQSHGNDIVISSDYCKNETINSILNEEALEIQPFQAVLKGINGNVDLVRLSYK